MFGAYSPEDIAAAVHDSVTQEVLQDLSDPEKLRASLAMSERRAGVR